MRTLPLPKLPPFSDIRECVCLLVLCGAMIFSVLNIGVHRLAERLWEPINHGLSPDGKEYASISLAGLRVHNVETGKESDRVTWLSPLETWQMRIDYGIEPHTHIAHHRADAVNFEVNNWQGHRGEKSEARVTVEISISGRYIVGKFPAGYAVWWDRHTDKVKVLYFADHLPLRCFIDEAKNRFHFESLRIPKPLFQLNASEQPEWDYLPNYLGRSLDVQEFRLTDAEMIGDYTDRACGAPVDNSPQLRLVADKQGENLALETWRDFPHGEPNVETLPSVNGILEVADCRAETGKDGVRLLESTEQGIFESELSHCQSIRTLIHKNVEPSSIAPLRTRGAYFCQNEGFSCLAIRLLDPEGRTRLVNIDRQLRWRDVLCKSDENASVVRLANETGLVLDVPIELEGPGRSRQIDLEPYPHKVLISVCTALVAYSVWLFHAIRTSTLIRSNGWLVLVAGGVWPLVCWLTNVALEFRGILVLFLAISTLLLCLSSSALLVRGSLIRTVAIALTTLIALAFVCALHAPYYF